MRILDRHRVEPGTVRAQASKKWSLCREHHIAGHVGFDQRADFKGLPVHPERYCSAAGTDQKLTNARPLMEAVMDGSRNERARARARYLLAQIAPLPDDAEVQRLRGLSMDYIREAERLERERVTTREPSDEISAALDEVARDYFARAVQSKPKE
jgi:hypothetical protein